MPLDATQSRSTPSFRFPGADTRSVIIGATGTGKTTFGFWLLSHARFDKRPWIIVDYKGEDLIDQIGVPPIQRLRTGKMPGKRGLYVMSPRPDEDDAVEDWLWQIWAKGNIGLFIDETTLLPHRHAWKAILRQGRSKLIPVIACTQRPVDCERETFTEASYFALFRQGSLDDAKTVKNYTQFPASRLPERHAWWIDVARNLQMHLRPVPGPDYISSRLREHVPYNWFFGR